jgi:hypothetical protein
MSCFWGHKWEKIYSQAKMCSIEFLGHNLGDERQVLTVEHCKKCGETKAYLKDSLGHKTEQDVDWVSAMFWEVREAIVKAEDKRLSSN